MFARAVQKSAQHAPQSAGAGFRWVLWLCCASWSIACAHEPRPSTTETKPHRQARDGFARHESAAVSALEAGKAQAALAELHAARKIRPNDVELLYLYGRAYQMSGEFGASYLAYVGYAEDGKVPARVASTEQALTTIGPLASAPLTSLLRDLILQEEPKEALDFIQLIRGYDEKYPVVQGDFRKASCEFLSLMAAAAMESERADDAARFSADAITMTRRCPLAFAVAARSALHRGDRLAAEKFFQQGLAGNPSVMMFHRDLAQLHAENGEHERAILHWQAYLTDDLEADEQKAARAMLDESKRHAQFEKIITRLTGQRDMPRSSGTGFLISREGYALTAAHVVKGAKRLKAVDAQGVAHAVELEFIDDDHDLALIKIEGTWHPLPLAGKPTTLGTEVFTIGYPDILVLGMSPKLASGVVSSTAGPLDAPHLMQISVPIQPGNSGGPLVDSAGDVVGMVVGRMKPGAYENVAYAIGSPDVKRLLGGKGDLPRPPRRKRGQPPEQDDGGASAAQHSVVLVLSW